METTLPMPLDAMAAAHGGLEPYRLGAAAEVAAMLRRLQEANVPLNLNTPQGGVYTTTLWATDAARGVLSFAADARDPQLQALLEGDEAVVVGYLENIKIQFDVDNLVLVHGAHASALNATYPGQLFRFQRHESAALLRLVDVALQRAFGVLAQAHHLAAQAHAARVGMDGGEVLQA